MVLFLWSRWSPDLVAAGALMALFLAGLTDLGPTPAGFVNSAVGVVFLATSLLLIPSSGRSDQSRLGQRRSRG